MRNEEKTDIRQADSFYFAKVLVVDSDRNQLQSICRGLFLHDYSYLGLVDANSALKALKQAEHEPFDVVLTDLTMPGDMGTWLVEQLLELRPELPIIAITGLNNTRAINALRQRGVLTLQKPFRPDDLDETIRSLVD